MAVESSGSGLAFPRWCRPFNTGVSALTGVLNKIFAQFPAQAQQCVQAAQKVSAVFTAMGQNPQTIQITDRLGARIFFLADGTTRFASTGFHQAVVVNGRVYDALTGPAGMTLADYILKLKSLNIDPVITNL